MAKLKMIRPKLRSGSPRLRPLKARPMMSDDRTARRQMYATKEWRSLRAQVRKACPGCMICGGRSAVVDHLLGHDDVMVAMLVEVYQLRNVAPHWRDRFWQRHFLIGLCKSCHDRKTQREGNGELAAWIEEHATRFGLPLLPSYKQTLQ